MNANEILPELETIEKAEKLRAKGLISELEYRNYLSKIRKKNDRLKVLEGLNNIIKDKKLDILNKKITDEGFFLTISDNKQNIVINYNEDVGYKVSSGNKTKLFIDKDSVTEYLKYNKSNQYSNMLYVLIVIILTSGILFFFKDGKIRSSKNRILSVDDNSFAEQSCKKLIENVENYSIKLEDIGNSNEIKVVFTDYLTGKYHICIYIKDEKKCEKTR